MYHYVLENRSEPEIIPLKTGRAIPGILTDMCCPLVSKSYISLVYLPKHSYWDMCCPLCPALSCPNLTSPWCAFQSILTGMCAAPYVLPLSVQILHLLDVLSIAFLLRCVLPPMCCPLCAALYMLPLELKILHFIDVPFMTF